MKKYLPLTLLITSFAAASEYQCKIEVTKNNSPVGTLEISKGFGTVAGRVAALRVSKKTNIFGKTTKEVSVIFYGSVQVGSELSDCSLKGDILLETIKTGRTTIETLAVGIARVSGSGAVKISGSSDHGFSAGYAVQGSCDLVQ